jgi:hypothetical protein
VGYSHAGWTTEKKQVLDYAEVGVWRGRKHHEKAVPHPPGFLLSLLGSANFMRLSLEKGAHAVLSSAAWQEPGVLCALGKGWDTRQWVSRFVASHPSQKARRMGHPGDLLRCRGKEMPRFIPCGSATPVNDGVFQSLFSPYVDRKESLGLLNPAGEIFPAFRLCSDASPAPFPIFALAHGPKVPCS